MGKLKLTDFYIYRWRYYIGYGLIVLLLALFLVFVGKNVPGMLTAPEMNAVVHGSTIHLSDPHSFATANAPFYRLQQRSIELLGVTVIGVKLPSLILAFITSVGAVLLLRRWFQPNVAILATLLMITTGQFLFVAQSGTPGITYMLWSVVLLYAATMMTNKEARHPIVWKAVFFILAGISLYAPLSLYLLIAIITAALWHPHVRFILKQMHKGTLALLSVLMLIPLVPLGYLIYLRPPFLLELLGKPAQWPPNILHNASVLVHQYFDFINASTGPLMTPVFGLGSLALILLGAWQLLRTHYNARSYTVAAWIILLVPVVLINPNYTSITFVPFLLLIASGLNYLLNSWYGLFPRNPYARVVGLIPMMILVGGLVISGIDRYAYGYRYSPDIVKNFTADPTLLNTELARTKDPISVVVSPDELPFYRILAQNDTKRHHTSIVVSSDPTQYYNQTAYVIVSHDAHFAYANRQPVRLITTSTYDNSDRFYIYKNTGN